MDIKGWARTSLIDFPGHIATVLFTAGCNFRCPMCHNAELVLRPGALPSLRLDELWAFLAKRAGKITGVVVTGGEPTLQPDLPELLERVRDLGYVVKLDSNGYRPDALADLLDADLVDFVAMDVKAPPEKYELLAGVPIWILGGSKHPSTCSLAGACLASSGRRSSRTCLTATTWRRLGVGCQARVPDRWCATFCSSSAVRIPWIQRLRTSRPIPVTGFARWLNAHASGCPR